MYHIFSTTPSAFVAVPLGFKCFLYEILCTYLFCLPWVQEIGLICLLSDIISQGIAQCLGLHSSSEEVNV